MENQSPMWQKSLSKAAKDKKVFTQALSHAIDESLYSEKAAHDFPLKAPIEFLSRIDSHNNNDPLLLQVMPSPLELIESKDYSTDPVGDLDAIKQKGLLHKYHGRVLLMTTSACAIHCRYCFRRHFPYTDFVIDKSQWAETLRVIENDPSIHEVILSGGDPLSLSDKRLQKICMQISEIDHIKTLRFHSRYPVVLPQRIDDSFLNWYASLPVKTVFVIHSNHAQEISASVSEALLKLHQTGTTLLNQSVLLKGVNDSTESLVALSHTLFDNHVLPYYLHLLDRVAGATHFEVSEAEALALHASMRALLPGYLLPELVREEAGKHHKTAIT